jgi:putative hydrolase of the HAD superfamily
MTITYRAVLFDFFGTLTQAIQRGDAHDAIARRLGCEPRPFAQALDATFLQRSTGGLGDAATALGMVARAAGGDPDPQTLRCVLADRVAAVRADIRLRPDAVPVLDVLHRYGLRTAVVSDCGPELPEILPSLPIAPYVDARVYSVDVGRRKPDAAMYLTACARLGVGPAECLYVGDGGSHELSGARDVGIDAIRLDAPDLRDHLVFDVDTGWSGPRVGCLTDVFDAVFAKRVAPAAR